MKNSHKFISLGIITAGLFGASMNAFAASNPDSFVPDSSIYVRLDSSKPHPFKGKLQGLFDLASHSSGNQIAQQLFSANLDNTVLGFSQTFHASNGQELFLVGFALDSNTFQKIIDSANPGDVTREDLGLNRVIYTSGEDFYFTYKNGNVIAANKKDLIHDQLYTDNTANLSHNTDYQNFLSKINPDSFLLGYFNFDKIPENDSSNPISNWLTSEAFAINQDSGGLAGKFYVNFKASTGWNTGKYLFTPALFAKVNAKNLIYYQESNNLTAHLQDVRKMLSQTGDIGEVENIFQEISTGIADETGVSLETDLAPLFQNRYAVMIHSDPNNTNWNAPAFSMMAEVKGQETNANAVLKKFQASIEKKLTDESENFTVKDIAFGSSTLKQLTITYQDPIYIDYNSEPTTATYVFPITFGVTTDGLMIFTTLKNPNDLTSATGLSSDEAWLKANSSQSQVIDISLLNIINLKSFIDKDSDLSSISQAISNFLSPLHYLTASTTGSANSLWVNFNLNMDLSQIATIQDAFTNLFDGLNFTPDDFTDQYETPQHLFKDVSSEDWFFSYVQGVYYSGIMQGSDEFFRPNESITRAEFVKTIIAAAEYSGQSLKLAKLSNNFSDVDGSEWYSSYINQARANDFITGYTDGSFHPNAPITRAEAMKILVNSDPDWFDTDPTVSTDHPFNDVNPYDWFYIPVYKVFDLGYVNGKTYNTFSPNTNLTRAEAAKIISLKAGLDY